MKKALLVGIILMLLVPVVAGVYVAKAVSKPSVPEFTLKFEDLSYDVPTTYSVDPYTGENVTHPSYHVENRTIEIRIKNQPFTLYYDASSGWNISFYYNVRMKGHYEENWTGLYSIDDLPARSDSEYTVLTYLSSANYYMINNFMIDFPPDAQVDFQVEAMIGYTHRTIQMPWNPWVFEGETSGWSNTQTITIPDTSASPNPTSSSSPTLSPSPSIPEFSSFIAVPILMATMLAGAIICKRKLRQSQTSRES